MRKTSILLASKEKFLIRIGYNLLDIPKGKLKIGLITTALQVVEDVEYLTYMKEYYTEMIKENIDFKEFDIKNKTENQIRDFFSDRNVVQVTGGNPFYLLQAIRETSFDTILKDLLDSGIVYVGCSAGSYIMCPTVEVGAWKASRNKYGVTDFTALGYVPFLLKCHYTDDAKENVLENTKDLKYPLRILRDDQAILVKDGVNTFKGGEEIRL